MFYINITYETMTLFLLRLKNSFSKKCMALEKIYLAHFEPFQSVNCLYQQRVKDTFTPIFHNMSMFELQ